MLKFTARAAIGALLSVTALSAFELPAEAASSAACNHAVRNTTAYRQFAQLQAKQSQGKQLTASERSKLQSSRSQVQAYVRTCRSNNNGTDPNGR